MLNEIEVLSFNEENRRTWDDFLSRQAVFALLQSWDWGELKRKQGWKPVRIAVRRNGKIVGAAQILIKPAARGLFSVTYVPRGPLADWANTEEITLLLEAIHQTARQHKAAFLRIEPPVQHSSLNHEFLKQHGFRASRHTNQPRCSMVVDQEGSMDELLATLPSSTRANIRKSERRGVTIDLANADDLPIFLHLMEITSKRDDFPLRSADYYEEEWRTFSRIGQAQLLIARYEGKAIAAQMPFTFGDHAATFHAGSTTEHRDLKAGYLMMWTAMCWARERGCRTFDLWGIPDEVGEMISQGRPIPQGEKGGLWGVYYYKNAFRGRVVYYVGAYDYVYSGPIYRVLDSTTGFVGSIDKLASLGDRLR